VIYLFDTFELDDEGFCLLNLGERVPLEPKSLRVLLLLVASPGKLIEKSVLLDAVWKDTFVEETTLTRAIALIRRQLGDDSRNPRFIETVPTLGYRFIAKLEHRSPAGEVGAGTAPSDNKSDSGFALTGLEPATAMGADTAIGGSNVESHGRAAASMQAHPHGRAFRRYAPIAIIAAATLAIGTWLRPTNVAGPLESTQITSSAEPKNGPLFTDGSRLYFNSRGEPVEMATSGGIIAPTRLFGPQFKLVDISADGSKALALGFETSQEIYRGALWMKSTLGGEPRKLTDHRATFGRWSPDGRSIVFADQRTLYRMDADGTNVATIWEAPGFVRDLSFSPDTRVLSVSVFESGADGKSNLAARSQLWRLDAEGKNAHPLRLDWPPGLSQFSGQWSPDGSHFVFNSDRDGRTNVYEVVDSPWFEFWKKPAAVRLTANQLAVQGVAPARDSKGLFVLEYPDQGTMQVLDPQSGRFVPYLDGLAALNFVISPDRQWMAYVEYPARHLWKSRLDGSERLQLTNHYSTMAQWSPDGKRLVYSNWHALFLVSANGGTPEELISDSKDGVVPVLPAWSPDGRSIAWSFFPYPDRPLTGIHMIELATRKLSVMPGSLEYYAASWSPDGKYLLAIARNPSRISLYSPEAKTWRDLKRFDMEWGFWIWSNDSKSIYMSPVDQQPGIYRLTIPDGVWTKVSGLDGINKLNGSDSFPSLTLDGRPVMMSRTGVAQIYSLAWKP
jgi:DNA-binding winged helix-turn-helix (wHTH) protein/Tol biopolymer transport system component